MAADAPLCDKCGAEMVPLGPSSLDHSDPWACGCTAWIRLAYTRSRDYAVYLTIRRPWMWLPTLRRAFKAGAISLRTMIEAERAMEEWQLRKHLAAHETLRAQSSSERPAVPEDDSCGWDTGAVDA